MTVPGTAWKDGLVHHSDAGSHCTSVSFAETLALEGIAASIGSIGDAYESTIGLFKNEAIRDGSPFRSGPLRTIDDVEWVTTDWADWYNGETSALDHRRRPARRVRGHVLR